MNKLKEFFINNRKEIFIPTAVMVCICIIVAFALSFTNKITAPKIEKMEKETREESMKSVMKADDYKEKQLEYDGQTVSYYEAADGGKTLGYIFITDRNGYGGNVSVMTAVNPDCSIKAVCILDVSDETPGLGKNAAKKDFYSQFSGKSDKISVVKNDPKEDKNEIKAVTGATITSKAVTGAVNQALEYAKEITSKGGNTDG